MLGRHHLQWAPEMLLRLLVILATLLGFAAPAWAEDWIATKLRGMAEVQIEGVWTPLARGDAVADQQLVRTLGDSRLELTRGADVIALGPHTQVRIEDDAATRYTLVRQDFGTVEVEAEVRDTKHLEVRTKFLAAVVKGTHFIVTADDTGAAVEVTHGLVAVQSLSNNYSADIPAGNSARIAALSGQLELAGATPLPVVRDPVGNPVLPTLPAAASVPSATAPAPTAATVGVTLPAAGSNQPGQATKTAGLGLAVSMQLPNAEVETTAGSGEIDLATTALGVAIGIAIGALALLMRRVFS